MKRSIGGEFRDRNGNRTYLSGFNEETKFLSVMGLFERFDREVTWFYFCVKRYSLVSMWRIGHSSLDKGYSSGTIETYFKRKLEEFNDRLDVVCDKNRKTRDLLDDF